MPSQPPSDAKPCTPASSEEARYRQLLDAMGEGFCVIEAMSTDIGVHDFRYVAANPAFATITGAEDVVGITLRDLFPDEAKGWIDIYDGVLASGTPLRFERRLAKLDRMLELHAYPLGADAPGQLGVVFADVTARRLAEKAQAESEARLEKLNASLERQVVERASARGRTWELSADLLGTVNTGGYFETSNPAWMTILGWSEAEVAATPILKLLHPEDIERSRVSFERAQAGRSILRFINRYRSKSGPYRWISWTGVLDGPLVYFSGRDVTDEREASLEMIEAQEALKTQRLEVVSRLTGAVAQDFDQLLTSVGTNLEFAEKRIAQRRHDEARGYISRAQASTRRAAGLIHRMLAHTHGRPLEPTPIDIHAVLENLRPVIARKARNAISVELEGPGSDWLAHVDGAQLENSLLSLVANAVAAMPAGGRLSLSTRTAWLDIAAARNCGLHPGQYVALRVSDTGAGMSPEVLERAFEPFFTTRSADHAEGLGLSLVLAFARQSGGHVSITSQIAHGTTVDLLLPRFMGELPTLAGDIATDLARPQTQH